MVAQRGCVICSSFMSNIVLYLDVFVSFLHDVIILLALLSLGVICFQYIASCCNLIAWKVIAKSVEEQVKSE